jgi:hypothetical protein
MLVWPSSMEILHKLYLLVAVHIDEFFPILSFYHKGKVEGVFCIMFLCTTGVAEVLSYTKPASTRNSTHIIL